MLKLNNIVVHYDQFQALTDITMDVKEGELVVLLGANGAGKSTIFNTISGLNPVSSGEINFLGKNVTRIRAHHMVRNGVVQCAEGRMLFLEMSVEDNLMMGGYVHRYQKANLRKWLKEVYELFPILHEKRNDPAGSLSGGQQQMVAIGRALMSRPKLVMMDEPSMGLAPLIVEQMFEIIQEINDNGTTVLLAEQNANAALRIADRGYVIENGHIVLSGTQQELLSNDEVRKAYIGA